MKLGLDTGPVLGDSPDLTDQDIATAVETTSAKHLAVLVAEASVERTLGVEGDSLRYSVRKHEIRRRGTNLYVRSSFVRSDGVPKVLVYRADWLHEPQT